MAAASPPASILAQTDSVKAIAAPDDARIISKLTATLDFVMASESPSLIAAAAFELGCQVQVVINRAHRRQGGVASAAGRQAAARTKAEAWQELANRIWEINPALSKRRTAELIAGHVNIVGSPRGIIADADTIRRAISKP